MSKWLDAAKAAAPHLFPDIQPPVPCAVSANSAIRQKTAVFRVPLASATNSPENADCAKIPELPAPETQKTAENCLTAQTALLAHGTEAEKPLTAPSSPIICIFCRKPVERGILGTGALAGEDLHMDCYWKRYPNGHPCRLSHAASLWCHSQYKPPRI